MMTTEAKRVAFLRVCQALTSQILADIVKECMLWVATQHAKAGGEMRGIYQVDTLYEAWASEHSKRAGDLVRLCVERNALESMSLIMNPGTKAVAEQVTGWKWAEIGGEYAKAEEPISCPSGEHEWKIVDDELTWCGKCGEIKR